jgi:hypothetical protein
MIRSVIAALLASVFLYAAPARAGMSYDNCTNFIPSLPATISTQGTWCFKKDLITGITSGAAVTIAANNVTLDCNDFKLGGLSAGIATRAVGVMSNEGTNVTVRNCNIRGFFNGVQILSPLGSGHLVENNRLDGNTHIGIKLGGDASVVRGNRISSTGSAEGVSEPVQAVGIWTIGSVDVLENIINGVSARGPSGGASVGVYSWINLNGSIIRNNIKNISPTGDGAYGILLEGPTGYLSVDSNTLTGEWLAGSTGVACTANNEHVILVRNVIGGWQFPQVGCAYDGGNTIFP